MHPMGYIRGGSDGEQAPAQDGAHRRRQELAERAEPEE